jgi:hypothetical protein
MFSKILLSFGDAVCIANLRHSSACFLYSPTRRIARLVQPIGRALSVNDPTLRTKTAGKRRDGDGGA